MRSTAILLVVLLVSASGASAANVAVFDNGSYVDTSGGGGAESDTVQASLAFLGHTVSTFTGFTGADWLAAGTANDLILIPELENGSLSAAMSAGDKLALASYVASGGGLIVMGGGFTGRDLLLLNTTFGFSLSGPSAVGTSFLDPIVAAGTAFAPQAGTLPPHSATDGVSRSSLPGGALDVYNDTGFTNTVFTVGVGLGQVARLGWDWFSAAPLGGADAGWLGVLDASVQQVAGPLAVPEPGTFALFGIGMLGLAGYRYRRRRKRPAAA